MLGNLSGKCAENRWKSPFSSALTSWKPAFPLLQSLESGVFLLKKRAALATGQPSYRNQ